MGSVRVVPSPSPLPGFKGFRRRRFDHRRLHRDYANWVVQPFANQRVIDNGYRHLPFTNDDDNTDNGNGLGLEGPAIGHSLAVEGHDARGATVIFQLDIGIAIEWPGWHGVLR